MSKKKKVIPIVIFFVILIAIIVGIILLGKPAPRAESLSETMRDAVLHESMKVSLSD